MGGQNHPISGPERTGQKGLTPLCPNRVSFNPLSEPRAGRKQNPTQLDRQKIECPVKQNLTQLGQEVPDRLSPRSFFTIQICQLFSPNILSPFFFKYIYISYFVPNRFSFAKLKSLEKHVKTFKTLLPG